MNVLRSVGRRWMLVVPAMAIATHIALAVPSGAAAASAAPSTPSVAAQPTMVTLPGSLHPRARPEFDVGRMAADTRLSGMSLLFRMSPQQKALQKYALAAVQDPASPSYHQWLTPEQYAAEFGASSSDVARATAWLSSQGLSIDGPARTATRLGFSGTIAQIEHAFGTEMHRYRVDGTNHFAMSRAPSVPADLASLVLGVHGMHDFRARAHGPRPQYVLPIPQPDGGTVRFPVLSPADFAKIYDIDSLYAAGITGAGQSIAVAEQSDFNDADIAEFRTTFGLPTNTPTRLLVPNSGTSTVSDVALFETELDLEWAGAVAPGATIVSVFTGDASNRNEFDALYYAVEQRAAPVVSASFGMCEQLYVPTDAIFLEGYGDTASLEGMTVLASSGDTGAAGCDTQSALVASHGEAVLFPASLPNFVAVGGSQFQLTSSNQPTYLDSQLDAVSYIPESAWNETLGDIDAGYGGLGASGGGMSRLFAKPYWQIPYTSNDGFRDVPDVALSASADILPYAVSMSWTAADGDAQAPQPEALTAYSGTSAAAPAFAGILALVNQALAKANPGMPIGLGNVNPILYALANDATTRNAFHDITTGDNMVPCEQGSPQCPSSPPYQFGYEAGPGYDQVTGLGSIDAANLVVAWKTMTPTSTSLTVTSSGTTAGLPLQLTATVASKATANAMTGSVTFYFVVAGDGGVGSFEALGVSQVTPSMASATEGATASLTAPAPGRLDGSSGEIGAVFGGDPHYLASWSTAGVTIVNDGTDGAPPPATVSCRSDAGEDGGLCGADATADAQSLGGFDGNGAADGSLEPSNDSSTSGCGCSAAGVETRGVASGLAGGIFLAFSVARGLFSHPRRRQSPRQRRSRRARRFRH
jgi:subtilase family serine protease